MSRGSTTGPFKSTAGFEVGAGGSGPDGTNTTVIDGDGNITAPGTLTACGNTTLSGTLTVCGTVVGMRGTMATVTASTSVADTQSGTTFLITSTSGGTVIMSLPATAAGLTYTFISTVGNTALADSNTIEITPVDVDKIGGTWNTTATTSYYTTLAAGTDKFPILGATGAIAIHDRLTLVGDGSAGWIVVEGFGGWADKGSS
jgi:hypothetical protein